MTGVGEIKYEFTVDREVRHQTGLSSSQTDIIVFEMLAWYVIGSPMIM